MDNPQPPIGAVENGHLLTQQGWVLLGTKSQGWVLTPNGWVKDDSSSGRLGMGIAVGAAGLLIAIIGLVMANASVSVLTGSGTNWTGAVITVIAVVAATVALVLLKAPPWISIVTGTVGILLVVLALASAVYIEVQLEHKRQEIADILGN